MYFSLPPHIDIIVNTMDTFNLEEELSRHAQCADKLYEISDKLFNSSDICHDVYEEWLVEVQAAIKEYNVTKLLPVLFAKTKAINVDSSKDQITVAMNDFYDTLEDKMAKIKINLTKLYMEAAETNRYECRLGKVKIKIELAACENGENKISFNDLRVMYDELGMGKRNSQWNPLLTGFIFNNESFSLTGVQIEDFGHTQRGRATDECLSKLRKILAKNRSYYQSQGKVFPNVSIKKQRSIDSWRLTIEAN